METLASLKMYYQCNQPLVTQSESLLKLRDIVKNNGTVLGWASGDHGGNADVDTGSPGEMQTGYVVGL